MRIMEINKARKTAEKIIHNTTDQPPTKEWE